MASLTAAVSEPALAVLMKTSKGWAPSFSLMVTKALPRGVLISKVRPTRARGRGLRDSVQNLNWPLSSAAGRAGSVPVFLLAVAWVSSTTLSREPVT